MKKAKAFNVENKPKRQRKPREHQYRKTYATPEHYKEINIVQFIEDLRRVFIERCIANLTSYSKVSRELKVSEGALWRIMNRKTYDVNIEFFTVLCKWMNKHPMDYIKMPVWIAEIEKERGLYPRKVYVNKGSPDYYRLSHQHEELKANIYQLCVEAGIWGRMNASDSVGAFGNGLQKFILQFMAEKGIKIEPSVSDSTKIEGEEKIG